MAEFSDMYLSDFLAAVALLLLVFTLAKLLRVTYQLRRPRMVLGLLGLIALSALAHFLDGGRLTGEIQGYTSLLGLVLRGGALVASILLASRWSWLFGRTRLTQPHEEMPRSLAVALESVRDLTAVRTELEARSTLLTVRTKRLAGAFAAARVVAAQWKIETGEVEWEIGYPLVAELMGLDHARLTSMQLLLSEADAHRLRQVCRCAMEGENSRIEFESKIAGSPDRSIRLSAEAQPAVKGEPASVVGMFRIVPVDVSGAPPSPPR